MGTLRICGLHVEEDVLLIQDGFFIYAGRHVCAALKCTCKMLRDTGIIMLETGDAICELASLLGMENFMIFAMTETDLFERALNKMQRKPVRQVELIAGMLPGRLWRIYGPEYACAPYLPPALYEKSENHRGNPMDLEEAVILQPPPMGFSRMCHRKIFMLMEVFLHQ